MASEAGWLKEALDPFCVVWGLIKAVLAARGQLCADDSSATSLEPRGHPDIGQLA